MKSSNTIVKRVVIFLLVTIGLFLGTVIWWTDGTSPVDQNDTTPAMFVIRRGEGARSIATNLAEQNLIRSPTAFFLLVKLMGIERNLQAGDFRLNRTMDAKTIAQELTHGTLDVWVTTLEGWRVEEIANRLAKDLDLPEAEFLKVAEEGYMFPDTYLVPRDATAGAVARLFFENFEKKMTAKMQEDVKRQGLSLREVITLASIVEREGRTDADRPIIAGILLKRLAAGWPLQADATLQYALGYQPQERSWWKKTLTEVDKQLKSSYNTYFVAGLPPGPISNPGLASIQAVLQPQETDYWYYLHDASGRVHFAKTLAEHNENVRKYLQSR